MRILIVEDDKSLADGLLRTLRQSRYAVDHAINGEMAVKACSEEHYDLLILDVGLPGICGFGVLEQLRAKHISTGSILMLTARDAETDRVRGLDLGADDYLIKPFALIELEARVRALLRRSQVGRVSGMQFGKLEIDFARREIQIGGLAVSLTPREWSVLECLLKEFGKVASKEQIQKVLRLGKGTENTVEVYISRLRAKLSFSGLGIRTVRGVGYLIFEEDQAVVSIPA